MAAMDMSVDVSNEALTSLASQLNTRLDATQSIVDNAMTTTNESIGRSQANIAQLEKKRKDHVPVAT